MERHFPFVHLLCFLAVRSFVTIRRYDSYGSVNVGVWVSVKKAQTPCTLIQCTLSSQLAVNVFCKVTPRCNTVSNDRTPSFDFDDDLLQHITKQNWPGCNGFIYSVH